MKELDTLKKTLAVIDEKLSHGDLIQVVQHVLFNLIKLEAGKDKQIEEKVDTIIPNLISQGPIKLLLKDVDKVKVVLPKVIHGKDGKDGKNGVDGKRGEKGERGETGKGKDGKDGRDGKDGEPGKDGKDGATGSAIFGGGVKPIVLKNGSTVVDKNIRVLNFTGAGVSVARSADGINTITIEGGGSSVPVIVNATDSNELTPDGGADITRQENTQVAGTLNINAPSGTYVDGKTIEIHITSDNAHTISYDPIYSQGSFFKFINNNSGGQTTDILVFQYFEPTEKWHLIRYQDSL